MGNSRAWASGDHGRLWGPVCGSPAHMRPKVSTLLCLATSGRMLPFALKFKSANLNEAQDSVHHRALVGGFASAVRAAAERAPARLAPAWGAFLWETSAPFPGVLAPSGSSQTRGGPGDEEVAWPRPTHPASEALRGAVGAGFASLPASSPRRTSRGSQVEAGFRGCAGWLARTKGCSAPRVCSPASLWPGGQSKGRGQQKPWRGLKTPRRKASKTPGQGPPAHFTEGKRRQASPRPWEGGAYGLKAERVPAKQVPRTSAGALRPPRCGDSLGRQLRRARKAVRVGGRRQNRSVSLMIKSFELRGCLLRY